MTVDHERVPVPAVVHVLDYGAGNLQSVLHALRVAGAERVVRVDGAVDWDRDIQVPLLLRSRLPMGRFPCPKF